MSLRTILITGGSGKLGRTLVSHFLSQGDRVIATCQSDESLSNMTVDYLVYGANFIGLQADLSEMNFANSLLDRLALKETYPDCLINNARSLSYLKVQENGLVSRENFVNEYILDVVAPYELTMALVRQSGSQIRTVLNVGSQYGTVAANPSLYDDPTEQSLVHYGVAKAALAHLTKELAVRLAKAGVRVNCVAFGGVDGRVDPDFKSRYSRLCPSGRMLNPDEIIGPIDMLLSEKCSGITGHILAVDGGWTIW
jgi:NAD(P)-dependent dehydrogenase (short-subunit alcohol dehydrogenase family)